MSIFRLDTRSVVIQAPAKKVWNFIADVRNWKQFSDFSKNMEQVGDNEWVAHTDQGDIKVRTFFDEEHLTLDQICYPNREEQLIPYRIIPMGAESCKLMMTNQQTPSVSDEEYEQQMGWIQQELETVKKILETDSPS